MVPVRLFFASLSSASEAHAAPNSYGIHFLSSGSPSETWLSDLRPPPNPIPTTTANSTSPTSPHSSPNSLSSPRKPNPSTPRIHACFALKKAELEKLALKSPNFYRLKIEIRRRKGRGTAGGKLLGCMAVRLDLKSILENLGQGNSRACVVQNGWVGVGGSGATLHLNVKFYFSKIK